MLPPSASGAEAGADSPSSMAFEVDTLPKLGRTRPPAMRSPGPGVNRRIWNVPHVPYSHYRSRKAILMSVIM